MREGPDTLATVRGLLKAIGAALACAAVAWIAWRFWQGGALSLLGRVPVSPWLLGFALVAAAGAYAVAFGSLAFAWWRLLSGLAPQAPPRAPTMTAWAVTQYGRYLPGNVAHYALRHAWSRRHATAHGALALAAAGEAGLLLVAALLVALVAAPAGWRIGGWDGRWIAAAAVGLLAAAWLAWNVVRRRGGIGGWVPPRLAPAMLGTVFACYLAFFIVTGAIVYAIGRLIGAQVDASIALAAGAASWAAGFAVIGAPGGLGVREATFVALTGQVLGEQHALLLIALYRIVTFFGDTLLFGAGLLALRRARKRSPAAT